MVCIYWWYTNASLLEMTCHKLVQVASECITVNAAFCSMLHTFIGMLAMFSTTFNAFVHENN